MNKIKQILKEILEEENVTGGGEVTSTPKIFKKINESEVEVPDNVYNAAERLSNLLNSHSKFGQNNNSADTVLDAILHKRMIDLHGWFNVADASGKSEDKKIKLTLLGWRQKCMNDTFRSEPVNELEINPNIKTVYRSYEDEDGGFDSIIYNIISSDTFYAKSATYKNIYNNYKYAISDYGAPSYSISFDDFVKTAKDKKILKYEDEDNEAYVVFLQNGIKFYDSENSDDPKRDALKQAEGTWGMDKNINESQLQKLIKQTLLKEASYGQFKKEVKFRSKNEMLHKGIKTVKSKLQEVDRIVEYMSRMKQELSENEDGLQYWDKTKQSINKIQEIVEALNNKIKTL